MYIYVKIINSIHFIYRLGLQRTRGLFDEIDKNVYILVIRFTYIVILFTLIIILIIL